MGFDQVRLDAQVVSRMRRNIAEAQALQKGEFCPALRQTVP
jgi:hypothetical protein